MNDHEYDDNAFDEWLRTAARDYNDPPAPDREGLWRAIQAERRERGTGRKGVGRWKQWGIGLAAMLALAIGIGRGSGPAGINSPSGPAAADRANMDFVTAEHLSRTEALLVIFRTAPRGQGVDPEVARWARDLLSTTRMIMDWSESDDPRFRRLLEDLELVLAQIVQLPVSSDADERDLIERSIEHANVLSRLRAMLPPPLPSGA